MRNRKPKPDPDAWFVAWNSFAVADDLRVVGRGMWLQPRGTIRLFSATRSTSWRQAPRSRSGRRWWRCKMRIPRLLPPPRRELVVCKRRLFVGGGYVEAGAKLAASDPFVMANPGAFEPAAKEA